jgi:hypothetical protein
LASFDSSISAAKIHRFSMTLDPVGSFLSELSRDESFTVSIIKCIYILEFIDLPIEQIGSQGEIVKPEKSH